jgi:hypothetical protein
VKTKEEIWIDGYNSGVKDAAIIMAVGKGVVPVTDCPYTGNEA